MQAHASEGKQEDLHCCSCRVQLSRGIVELQQLAVLKSLTEPGGHPYNNNSAYNRNPTFSQ